MNSSEQKVKIFSNYIKNLHNQENSQIPDEFSWIISDFTVITTLKILNLNINSSLDDIGELENNSKPKYFERRSFVISKIVRKIGLITKFLAPLCNFNDPREKYLAMFQTVNFYQQMQKSNQIPLQFINFVKGIYPSVNVHKDNIPLYMPFYERLESYDCSMAGNPNWQTTRKNLDFIYRRDILQSPDQEDLWYLVLTGSQKIINIFNKSTIEQVWSSMYYCYLNQTLKLYKHFCPQKSGPAEVNLTKILEVLIQNSQSQKNSLISHLFKLIFYSLTEDIDQLKQSLQSFRLEFDLVLINFEENSQYKKKCSQFGLINTLYCQLLHNLVQIQNKKNIPNQAIVTKLQNMLDPTVQVNKTLVQRQIPNFDYYLRIAYPSHSNQKNQIQSNQKKILQILNQGLQKSTNGFPLPQYAYYETAFLQDFSKSYLNKYPQRIIELTKFLPKDVSIWRLLNSQKLNQYQDFQQIKDWLVKNQQAFIREIKRQAKISKQDYQSFLNAWNIFHIISQAKKQEVTFQYQKKKVRKCSLGLKRLSDVDVQIKKEFKEKVYLPLKKSENLLLITDLMIQSFEQLIPSLDQQQKDQILKEYLSFLLDKTVKQKVLTILSNEQTTQFWRKWISVYMIDESLTSELINAPGQIQEEKSQGQLASRMEDQLQNAPCNNAMQIDSD